MALHPTRDTLHVISLCTGGGGLDLGLGLAIPGARAICMVEREAFAVAHLVSAMEEGLMAPCPVWSDARTFDGRPWRGLVDGLIGGIPCQPHSLAGRKRGSLDERDLWSPTRRIIAQARPWFVLIENVAGMLSPGADEIAGAERVWRDLRRLGFTVEGGLFTAAEVGAPHERE
ncbi:MAG TPA: DNA cytosine methyltransferase, partial [Methylophilaceae bacterium]